MQPGTRGLNVEQRHWLRTICRSDALGSGVAMAVPLAVRERLVALNLLRVIGGSLEVTIAGLAEALRTCKP